MLPSLTPRTIVQLLVTFLFIYAFISWAWIWIDPFYSALLKKVVLGVFCTFYDLTIVNTEMYEYKKVIMTEVIFSSEPIANPFNPAENGIFHGSIRQIPLILSVITYNLPLAFSLLGTVFLFIRKKFVVYTIFEIILIILATHLILVLTMFLMAIERSAASDPAYYFYFNNFYMVTPSVLANVSDFIQSFLVRFEPFLALIYVLFRLKIIGHDKYSSA